MADIIVAILNDVEEAKKLKSADYLNIMPASKRADIVKAIENFEN